MMHGANSKWRWFPLVLLMFLLAWLMLDSLRAEAQEPKAPAVAEEAAPLSGFDLIDAYSLKLKTLKDFQEARRLQDTELQNRDSQAAVELNRLIGGVELLMLEEAEKIYAQAMSAESPEVRDRLLTQLKDLKPLQLQEVRGRAENELKRRTVGETIYPTIEEAEEKQRELNRERLKSRAEVEKQDLEGVKKLEQDLGTDVLKAAQVFAERDASEKLEAAVRLVLPQRMVKLKEISRQYADTTAGAEALAMLDAIQKEREVIAGKKLHQAKLAPEIYGQRWRRLKEIERDYPATQAAALAQKIFAEHLALVPPVQLANHTNGRVELTVDRPYGLLEELKLWPGDQRDIHTAFPLMIRIHVGEDEWNVYRAWPGLPYVVQTTQGLPVLYYQPCAPELIEAPKPANLSAPSK
jgi:hypothetical protein